MVGKLKNLCGISILLLILLIVIPTSFALNETQAISDMAVDDNDGVPLTDLFSLTSDYYFNSSNVNAGDGSIDNPYRELTLKRIKDDSTIHLANGEYTLNKGKTVNDVIFIGENPEKTILTYVGYNDCGEFAVDANNYVVLKNLTIVGFNFYVEGGTIQAENCIFKNTIAPPSESSGTDLVNSAVNSFGGVISASYSEGYINDYDPTVHINNCTFINNTAEYGGAVFISYGELSISNSAFYDNYAHNYGGAIVASHEVEVTITNTLFSDDKSVNDAGGAIYLLDSKLLANNVSIVNCSSTFGGAITSLNSTLDIVYLNAADNVALYDGGAIYQMYNDISVTYSNFTNNRAQNGGAIFVDDVGNFELAYNNFEENLANLKGGAVYSIFTQSSNLNNNAFKRNRANDTDDVYESDELNLRIGNGNYTLVYSNYTYDGELPKKYSLIDDNYVTPVKDQLAGGNCWAFATIAALESSILKATGQSIILSDENMKNIIELYSDYGWDMETNEGGFNEMSYAYLVSWLGPVLQSLDEYDDYSMLSPLFDAYTHVQNIMFVGRESYTDNDAIKRAVMSYGGVAVGMYMDQSAYFSTRTNSYYCPNADYDNHQVVIVGWDDTYSKSNFKKAPQGNGAWICKNSWNTDWGDEGYFYVSYYDVRVAEVGNPEACYVFVFNDSEKYERNYQYDIIGKTDYFVTNSENIWVKNVFEAADDELLAGVSTYFRKTTDYELFIYVNDELAFTKNGTCIPGYTTINLGKYIPLSSGDKFSVVFRLIGDDVEFAISENLRATRLSYAPGVSFFSKDGNKWTDLFDYSASVSYDGGHNYNSQVAAIKAFTILDTAQPLIQFDVATEYNHANIRVTVGDPVSDKVVYYGNISINIEGVDYNLKLKNGEAYIEHEFNDLGEYEIDASFGHYSSSTKLNITKIHLSFNSDVVVVKDTASIDVETLDTVNTNLNVRINNQSYQIDVINGKGNLTLNDLELGDYLVFASVDDDSYVGEFNSSFKIIITKAIINASDLISYYDSNRKYSVELTDINGNPVANRQLSFVIGDKVYNATTNELGVASTTIELKNATMDIIFDGDEQYFPTNATVNLALRSSIVLFKPTYLTNLEYKVCLLDADGNPINLTQTKVIIDGKDYWSKVDNGLISIPLNLDVGNHSVIIENYVTGEKAIQFISCISRIAESSDLNIYYLSQTPYKVRVYGDDANPAGANETVHMLVNSNVYPVQTNNDGYALFVVPLTPGTYTILATYKGETVSNTIVVKPLLKANDITKKKAKNIKFSAKLVDSNGNPDKGKIITFKIKSKTYKAKTNAKGIAKIKIKNLKVGKYKIKTKFGSTTIKNIIKIKR